MQPVQVIQIHPSAFGSPTSCLGVQLVKILRVIGSFPVDLHWHVADVQAVGQFPFARQPLPRLIGPTDALIEAATMVDQFESGVFAGVPSSNATPSFRSGGLWTEDEDDADLGDAMVEVRAFDTAYWLVSPADIALADLVRKRFEL